MGIDQAHDGAEGTEGSAFASEERLPTVDDDQVTVVPLEVIASSLGG